MRGYEREGEISGEMYEKKIMEKLCGYFEWRYQYTMYDHMLLKQKQLE